jgi:hypothetical protein
MSLQVSIPRCRMSALAAIAGTLAAALTATAAPRPMPDPAPQRPFSATSVWNAAVPAKAPLADNSEAMVADLGRQVRGAGAWINSWQWSTPVYQVPSGQATVAVRLDTPSSMYTNAADAAELTRQLAAVPIPLTAQPAAGTDHHLVIWQPSTDTMWELWLARLVQTAQGPVWHAAWGSRIDGASASTGINAYPFGATASGLPMVGGLMTRDEVTNRSIPHALALAIPETAAHRFVWPANRTDGNSSSPDVLPEGAHLRLDPTVDVDALGLPPLARAMAVAAQRYGIIVRDRAGAVAFYAEDTGPLGMVQDFGGLTPAALLARFPWNRLQVLEPTRASSTRSPSGARSSRGHRQARRG